MTTFRLLVRNLRYFRGVNIAVVAGMAVATAVLTGALMVGDSVRGSLVDLARQRLGWIDYALISNRFFEQTLIERMGSSFGRDSNLVAAILIRGGAAGEEGGLRTADVQINALSSVAGTTPGVTPADFPPARGNCVINGELADAIGAGPGATILLSVPTQSDVPRESALARRGRGDTLATLRVTVSRVVREPGLVSLFDPNGSQRVPRNAWVNLADLQEMIEQTGRINAIFVYKGAPTDDTANVTNLNDKLRQVAQLEDYGVSLRPVGDAEVGLFARDTYIAPPVVDAAKAASYALHIRLRPVSVNLLNIVKNKSALEGHVIHYAVAAGINELDDGPLAENEVAINQWTADQLGAKVGDHLSIDFSVRETDGNLSDAGKVLPPGQLTFTVKTVLPMQGLGAETKLPPNYKGLTDARSVADWDPPEGLLIDKTLVTRADEDYWHAWRAAPKIFLNFNTATKLWGGPYGAVTGLRVPAGDAERFGRELLARLRPGSMGLVFQPIKAQQISAARGGTDFAEFFLMFSFFLIVAAALLVAMLFRLNVEQRARQLGLLGALGFSPGKLRRLSLNEGMILALIGGVIGLAGAIGYTWLIMAGLRTWWVGAVGTTSMRLYIVPLTLIYGLVGSLIVAFFAIQWAVWRVGRASSGRLLAGAWGLDTFKRRDGRITRWIGIALALAGVATVATAAAGKLSAEEGFGGGALLLVGALCWLGGTLRPRRHDGASFIGSASLFRLGVRNASRHTARGVLAVGLIGFAAFTLITVAAMRQNGIADPGNRNSETGGYRLLLSADIPLLGDLNSLQGRKILGIRDPQSPIFQDVHFTSLRVWAGQDISCLNLTKPNSPTILGIPPEMIERGGFIKGSMIQSTDNPWKLLNGKQDDAVPVMADADTQEYVLKVPIGGEMTITDQLGVQRKLRLVATIAHSIFQGQLLMSDINFRQLFPAQGGFGRVLVDVPKEMPARKVQELQRVLASELAEFSVSVDTTADRLKVYQNVQNTYLSTFQTLGALGLMLGTLGLAVVLVRTVIERKSELALLASLGFTSAARVRLVLAENAFLLVLGLGVGASCAVIGVIPAAMSSARSINAGGLALTLAVVLLLGLAASTLAVKLSGAHISPADLRRE